MERPPIHLGAGAATPGGWFTGEIPTLTDGLEGPEPPVADKASDKSPDFRITCGNAGLGPPEDDQQG